MIDGLAGGWASPPLLLAASGAALATFVIYSLAVFGLAWASHKLLSKREFVSEYFLGSRSLGMWAFALTFAATSASGGSFTGFPALIYSHGWILALWIASYMVVPICAMGLLGKRLNQVARISQSITVPDVLRDRFNSPLLGMVSVLLIVFFMAFNLGGQFKAGSVILQSLLEDAPLFNQASLVVGQLAASLPGMQGADGGYLLCLLCFGVAVILYTTYGGFHAVVWTDVMQGIVMVAGVLILLPLTLRLAGGMENATRAMAAMEPPRFGSGQLSLADAAKVAAGDYILLTAPTVEPAEAAPAPIAEKARGPRLFRLLGSPRIGAEVAEVDVLEIITTGDQRTILQRPSSVVHRELPLQATVKPYAAGAEGWGAYVSGPGPDEKQAAGFLPLSLAFSFFLMWAISGAGQPSSMVRLMAFNNSLTLRNAIITVAVYYSLIYFPLVIIFCCARVLLPGMDAQPDSIMPSMAIFVTREVGFGWLAGLVLAAPFAAVMSTVDSFLLLASSALVRDVYQRGINPRASEATIKKLSYLTTFIVGALAMAGAVNPPKFLQSIIVYTGSGLTASFLAPMACALYWPRVNLAGCLGGMIAGFVAHTTMFVIGIVANGSFFRPYLLGNLDPIVIGLGVSLLAVICLSWLTAPPDEALTRRYFCGADGEN